MTDVEGAVFAEHFRRFQQMMADGVIIMVGPTLGEINTGLAVFEAPDEPTALAIMNDDPVIKAGVCRGELRPYRVSLLRGRD